MTTTSAPSRPEVSHRWAARAGLAGAVTALAVAAVVGTMHLVAPWSRHDSVRRTISEYAVGAGGWLFDVAVLGLVAATVAVVAGLVGRGLLSPRSAAVALYAVWCAGLVLVVVFEKTNWSVGPSLSGSIHRYASLAAFLCLPVAGLLTARAWRRREGPGGWSRAVVACSVTALAMFVPIVAAIVLGPVTGVPWWRAVPLGLLERVLSLAEVAVVVVLGLRAARSPRPVIRPDGG